MVVGIDGNEANITNRVGVNVYAYEILKALHRKLKISQNSDKLIVYLKNDPLEDLPKEDRHLEYRVLKGRSLWIIRKLTPELVKKGREFDVFFSPNHYVPIISKCPLVCAVMDVDYLNNSGQFKMKDFWQLKIWSAYSMFLSANIVAISESTKNQIVRHYPFASDKVTVTHLAYDKDFFNENISKNDVRLILEKYSITRKYVLFLSTLKPSKNIEGLITAWSKIGNKAEGYKLVIAGKKGWLFDSIFEKVKSLNLEQKIVFTDFVPEIDKPALIKGAYVFILPSFWEGFGLDPLNAMACGVPVVVSRVGSLPEVVGDAGVYVDPNSIQSIADGLKSVLSMGKVDYNKQVRKGLVQASKFSWDKTAGQTLVVLRRVSKK